MLAYYKISCMQSDIGLNLIPVYGNTLIDTLLNLKTSFTSGACMHIYDFGTVHASLEVNVLDIYHGKTQKSYNLVTRQSVF